MKIFFLKEISIVTIKNYGNVFLVYVICDLTSCANRKSHSGTTGDGLRLSVFTPILTNCPHDEKHILG